MASIAAVVTTVSTVASMVELVIDAIKAFIDVVKKDDKEAEKAFELIKQQYAAVIENIKYKIHECCESSCRIYWMCFYGTVFLALLLLFEIYVVAKDWQGKVKSSRHSKPEKQPTIVVVNPTSENIQPKKNDTFSG